MAYVPAGLSVGLQLIGGEFRIWVYKSADPFATVDNTDYFSDATAKGMKEGDFVIVQDTDSDPPDNTIAYVSAIDADGNGTVTAAAFSGAFSGSTGTFSGAVTVGGALTAQAAATVGTTLGVTGATTAAGITCTTLTATGTSSIGDAAADLVAFHGTAAAGASQRASSIQATSNIASSTDFGATQLALIQEIMTTLTSKGIWKGVA